MPPNHSEDLATSCDAQVFLAKVATDPEHEETIKKLKSRATDPDARRERFKCFIMNLKHEDFHEYIERLKMMGHNLDVLAQSLNDSPEEYRLRALKRLKSSNSIIYDEVIQIITGISLTRKELDPNYLFPCVATDQYVGMLPETAQTCKHCSKAFAEGVDMIWKPCEKHVFCLKCWRGLSNGTFGRGLPLPFNALCTCSGFQYV